MENPRPRPDLTKVEYALIQHFYLLFDEQRSYRSVLTPERLCRHDFYPSPSSKVVGILDSSFFLCSPFNCTLAISTDRSMSQFSSNHPFPSRSRFSRGPSAASGRQPLVFSSSPDVVPTSTTIMNPSSDEVGSLAPVPSHGHSVNKDVVTPTEPLEPVPQMDKGKQPIEEGFRR